MRLRFLNSVMFVKDIVRSKIFYRDILGLKIVQDLGRYVAFEGGFGLWERDYAMSVIFPGQDKPSSVLSHEAELYFETDNLDRMVLKLEADHLKFIHGIIEHDWGQRGLRIYDPDGIILEISEPMSVVVQRFQKAGLGILEIARKTGMSASEVRRLL
jgi:catechol 2,3-dioxygenase-like lactoylglutathione lyase family enzyme